MVQKCANIKYAKKYVLTVKVIKSALINNEKAAAKSVVDRKSVNMAIISICVFNVVE